MSWGPAYAHHSTTISPRGLAPHVEPAYCEYPRWASIEPAVAKGDIARLVDLIEG